MNLPVLRLNKNQDRRIRAGHTWVYSNEVDNKHSPLKAFEKGALIVIEDYRGHALGTGYINPNSLICARLVSRDRSYVLDASLIKHRLNQALALRERLFDKPYYRLLFSDSDGLPGLIVDRFADILVVQISTAGMDRLKTEVIAVLEKVLRPKVIILRNDSPMRALEELDEYVDVVFGEEPKLIPLIENEVSFEVPALTGQKTGWYYDQRMNRRQLRHYCKDKRVLDVFSYVGGWGIQAAVAGASEVLCVESSASAVDQIHLNATLNNQTDNVATLHGDAFDGLKQLHLAGEKFDVVIVDPPAFIKRKKDQKQGEIAYQRINQQAMQLLNINGQKDGLLISASCSYHFSREQLLQTINKAGRHIDRRLQIVGQGHQGPDHPIHPAMVETEYLHAFFVRVLHP